MYVIKSYVNNKPNVIHQKTSSQSLKLGAYLGISYEAKHSNIYADTGSLYDSMSAGLYFWINVSKVLINYA